MAITSKGFAGGPMTDDDFGAIAARAAWVENAAALAVTQPNSGTRTVSIAAGTAVAHGVRAINDAAISQALTAPGSGGQWYLLVLRRDWTSGVKTTTLQVLTGASTGSTTAPTAIPTALPATFQSAAGSAQADQPLAWEWVSSASTTVTIFDARIIDQRNRLLQAVSFAALATLALVLTLAAGTTLQTTDGNTWRWNGTAWILDRGDGSSGIQFAGSLGNISSNERCTVVRSGPQVTLNLAVTGGALAQDGAILNVPIDYAAPGDQQEWQHVAVLNSSGNLAGVATVYMANQTLKFHQWLPAGASTASTTLASGNRLNGAFPYRAAA